MVYILGLEKKHDFDKPVAMCDIMLKYRDVYLYYLDNRCAWGYYKFPTAYFIWLYDHNRMKRLNSKFIEYRFIIEHFWASWLL